MTPAAISLITKKAIILLSDKKTRTTILIIAVVIVLLPLILIFLLVLLIANLFNFINPFDEFGNPQSDVFNNAVTELKQQYLIENDLQPELIRAVSLINDYNVLGGYFQTENPAETEILSQTKAYIFDFCVDEFSSDEQQKYIFLDKSEIIENIKKSPFNFTNTQLSLIDQIILLSTNSSSNLIQTGDYPLPVTTDYTITSRFRYRTDPFGRPTAEFHGALDIQPKHRSDIISIADGEVVVANTKTSGYGN